MEKRKFSLLIILWFSVACNPSDYSDAETMTTVSFVDIERFMGDWYVIANIPTFIEKGSTNAIESYRLNKNGEIETKFTFYQNTPNGNKKVYTPKGFIYNRKTNAEWRMQFIWPFKLPFFIIDLADDYSYTVIGVPSRKYVWIMAREPQLTDDTFKAIVQKLKGIGYDISQIQKILQDWG